MTPAVPNAVLPAGAKLPDGGVMVAKGARASDGWEFHNATMQGLVWLLKITSPQVPVRDRTGLTGGYDFRVPRVQLPPEADHVFTLPVDHLGLKVEPVKERRPILVIDHLEKPRPE